MMSLSISMLIRAAFIFVGVFVADSISRDGQPVLGWLLGGCIIGAGSCFELVKTRPNPWPRTLLAIAVSSGAAGLAAFLMY
ncbi:hypothetical protein GF420_06325 [candidate division GN15 bacterium]|nr:hypothetical protein [candidate division GN15 bacterium]